MLDNYLMIFKKIIIKKADCLRFGKMSFYFSNVRIFKIKINRIINKIISSENITKMIFSILLWSLGVNKKKYLLLI